ncbi:helix-turn-helix domain-containing protein [Phycicoccus sp. MAQZ13P-2]|uniref:helix-turn-helix domain-containing protein n=1 Tax=Phycicoccus mangrovi TaxID=2840470 RepID=UPI001C00054C|nr:helix-turn-helix transcriptional regulator [Phycicoccus mangrovi]MBT9257956.1 helix-turn-helix domain-containing protein [Phycicoccus mangrovi]MBT9276220.1 helix-turn-helix domain-containing protein [Phycicoccus mangrovi]
MTTTEALEQQRALYGAPLADLASEVRGALGLSQAGLARVLGLSAPMLSQLLSGQRTKIGNPAVVHRLESLLDLARRGAPADAEGLQARLEEIAAEQATLTADAGADVAAAARALARVVDADELAAAASRVGSPVLAEVLRRAADVARG